MSTWKSLCYRARQEVPHAAHLWRNGIEVQYDVRCPGYNEPRGTGA